jgi:hypothetical protein
MLGYTLLESSFLELFCYNYVIPVRKDDSMKKKIDICRVVERFMTYSRSYASASRINKGYYQFYRDGNRIEVLVKSKKLYFYEYIGSIIPAEEPKIEKEFISFLTELKKEFIFPEEIMEYLIRRRLTTLYS